MPDLVAIVLPPGRTFVRHLVAAWTKGDAVMPVDPRLPAPAVRQLLDAFRPARVVDGTGDGPGLPGAVPVERGDAIVVATGGTTGRLKGVVLSLGSIEAAAAATTRRLGVDPASDGWLAVLPVAHMGGLGVVARALLSATPLAFDWSDRRATLTALVPTLANRHEISRFRKVLVGGSADWARRPHNVVRTYGLTESGGGIVYDGVPLEGVEVRLDPGGQILLRGEMLLRSYRDGTDPKDAEGWLPTGDAGFFDEEGRLVVQGRLDDVIVTGGEKVWPAVVEQALRTHPQVAAAAVAGAADPEWGMRVVAWVVPADPAHPPTLEGLRRHVKETLPREAAPRQLEIMAELPRTPLGKVQRKLLVMPVSGTRSGGYEA